MWKVMTFAVVAVATASAGMAAGGDKKTAKPASTATGQPKPICYSELPTGSRFARRVCRTGVQTDDQQRDIHEMLNRASAPVDRTGGQ